MIAVVVSCGPSWQSKALAQLNTAREQENADYERVRVYPSCEGAPEGARCGPVMPHLLTEEARSGFRERVCEPKGLAEKHCENFWLSRVHRELMKRYSLADWDKAEAECRARGERCATLAHLEAILYAQHARSLDAAHVDNLARIQESEERVRSGSAQPEEFGLAPPPSRATTATSPTRTAADDASDRETARTLLRALGAALGALGGANEEKYSGCCSYHQGVCGCLDGKVRCCDGQPSPTCRC